MRDPLEDLLKLAPSLPDAVKGVQLGEKAERSLVKFADAERPRRRLGALVQLAVLLEARGDAQIRDHCQEALAAAEEAAGAMTEAHDAASLEIAEACHAEFIGALAKFETLVRARWRVVAEQQFGSLASVGGLLAHFPGAADLGARMSDAALAASQSAQAVRPLEDLTSTVRDLAAQRVRLLDEQQELAGDPEVATFLQALADQRARLDLLTPKVLDWLKDKGALSALQVISA